MKNSYILILSFILSLSASAQNFYYHLTYGTEAAYDWSYSGTSVLSSVGGDKNDVLSTAQALPFAWNFGAGAVTHYKVSDNGYITFDTSSITSYSANIGTMSTAGPNRAIFGFWDDLELKSYNTVHDYIYKWTYGSAPNRIHVIQWHGATPQGRSPQTENLFFAIRIYEAGGFDVVYNFRNSSTVTGTTGVEDTSSTMAGVIGKMVTGSPSINLPSAPLLEVNRPVYKFIFGNQPSQDIHGLKLTMPEIVSAGTSVSVTGQLINYGSSNVNSYRLNYMINNGPVQSQNYSGQNIGNNVIRNFTHNISWTPTGAGSFSNLKVWADSINGVADMNNTNDTLDENIFVNQGTAGTKKSFIEEYSTAPCGYCPNGTYVMDTILTNHHDILGVTHHAGYLTDAMTIAASSTLATEFAPGAPYASFDRVEWPGEFYPSSGNRNVWSSRAVTRLNTPTPVNVSLSTTWASSTRMLSISVDANFVDYAYPGDLRISVFVIEDSVTGTGSGYDQTNYYNTTTGSPFFGRGNPMVGYAHRHVLRAVPSSTWGTSGIIPSNPAPGQTFSNSYQYIVPVGYNENKMSAIAFVNYYDANGRREILNAEEHENITVGLKEIQKKSVQQISVYPNPSLGLTAAHFNLLNEDRVSLSVINMIGENIFSIESQNYTAGEHALFFDTANLPAGIYNVTLQTSNGAISQKLIVSK